MKNIKTKDIVVLIVATVIIVVSVYVMWTLLSPKPKNETTEETQGKDQITGQIDEETYKRIESLSDYGQPNLDGIGKSNLFE